MADDKSEQIKLVVFIKRRGGTVTAREVTQCYWPLKNQRVKAEAMLNELVTIGRAEWKDVEPTTRGGRPTRRIRLLPVKHSKGHYMTTITMPTITGKEGSLSVTKRS